MEGVIEHRLAILLKNFDNWTYLDYMRRISTVEESEFLLSPVKSADGGGKIAFRIKFNWPVFLILSHPICKFRSQRYYPLREGYFATLGLVPVFFSTLNRMTVLKLWGNRSVDFFNPSNQPLPRGETVCWMFPPDKRPAEFSTMNFVEQNGSMPDAAGSFLTEVFEKHFRWLYWVLPSRGFSGSAHFLYGRNNITSFIKISKSLYQIEEIQNLQSLMIEGKEIQTRQVVVKALSEDNGKYFFTRIHALMDSELVSEIMNDNNIETAFINGTISEIRVRGGKRYSLLTVKADYALSRFDVIQCLTGIVASRRFQLSGSLGDISAINEIRAEVGDILYDVEREMRIPFTISDLVQDLFETCVSNMFPVLLRIGDRIKLVHPSIWSFLIHWNLLVKNDPTKQTLILDSLLKILESGKSYRRLYLSKESQAICKPGMDKGEILKSVYSLKRLINTCKEIDGIFEDDISSP